LPNLRSYIDGTGFRTHPSERGCYDLGRIVVFYEPHRERRAWIEILVQQLSYRFAQQRSYGRAPNWLQKGLAQHLAARWSNPNPAAPKEPQLLNEMLPWLQLDGALLGIFGALITQAAYRQSEEIVGWLVSTFGLQRTLGLLDALRSEDTAAAAFLRTFAEGPGTLEGRWIREKCQALAKAAPGRALPKWCDQR